MCLTEYDTSSQYGDDDKPYATLGYANGPGYRYHRTEGGRLENEMPRRDLEPLQDFMSTYSHVLVRIL